MCIIIFAVFFFICVKRSQCVVCAVEYMMLLAFITHTYATVINADNIINCMVYTTHFNMENIWIMNIMIQ